MRKVVIDCDPGIDDASALLLALAPGNLDVRAITTVSGNLRASSCTQNLKKVLSMTNRLDVPIGQGPDKPLVRKYPRDPFSHGSDGLGDLGMPELSTEPWDATGNTVAVASDLIVDTVNRHAGNISVICLGPLTNLALALIKDPELPRKVEKVIIIGGSFGFSPSEALHATGDNPVSEWNIYVDPEAAELVWGAKFNLTAIGMDIFCQPCIAMTQRYQDKLAQLARGGVRHRRVHHGNRKGRLSGGDQVGHRARADRGGPPQKLQVAGPAANRRRGPCGRGKISRHIDRGIYQILKKLYSYEKELSKQDAQVPRAPRRARVLAVPPLQDAVPLPQQRPDVFPVHQPGHPVLAGRRQPDRLAHLAKRRFLGGFRVRRAETRRGAQQGRPAAGRAPRRRDGRPGARPPARGVEPARQAVLRRDAVPGRAPRRRHDADPLQQGAGARHLAARAHAPGRRRRRRQRRAVRAARQRARAARRRLLRPLGRHLHGPAQLRHRAAHAVPAAARRAVRAGAPLLPRPPAPEHGRACALAAPHDPAAALGVAARRAADQVPDPGVSADCAFLHLALVPGVLLRRLVSVGLRAAALHHARDGPQPAVGPVQDAPGPHREFPALEPARAHAPVLLHPLGPAVPDRHAAARPVPQHPRHPVGVELRRPHRQPALDPAHAVQRAAVQGAARDLAQGPQVVLQRLEAPARAGHRRPGHRDHLPLLQGDAVPQSAPHDARPETDPGPGHRVRETDKHIQGDGHHAAGQEQRPDQVLHAVCGAEPRAARQERARAGHDRDLPRFRAQGGVLQPVCVGLPPAARVCCALLCAAVILIPLAPRAGTRWHLSL
ncbi:hypothetical protein KL942_004022 [Ogataea angusta]|nr:hypothetical protein KL942_004022 [Ogataea angusta]